jgi:hypothetical protein
LVDSKVGIGYFIAKEIGALVLSIVLCDGGVVIWEEFVLVLV